MTGHGSITVVGGFPVRCDGRLRLCQRDLAGTNEALQLHLDAVLAPCFGPGLKLEFVEGARVTTKRKRHNVIEFVAAGC